MSLTIDTQTITAITINSLFQSVFTTMTVNLSEVNGMYISERQPSLNFRHRKSLSGYESQWHVAGDPTLIIVLDGSIELTVRSGEQRTFNKGEQFIAADYLPKDLAFTEAHGHRARVVGDGVFQAVHIKLSSDPELWTREFTSSEL